MHRRSFNKTASSPSFHSRLAGLFSNRLHHPVRIGLARLAVRVRQEPDCVCRGFVKNALDDVNAAYAAAKTGVPGSSRSSAASRATGKSNRKGANPTRGFFSCPADTDWIGLRDRPGQPSIANADQPARNSIVLDARRIPCPYVTIGPGLSISRNLPKRRQVATGDVQPRFRSANHSKAALEKLGAWAAAAPQIRDWPKACARR